ILPSSNISEARNGQGASDRCRGADSGKGRRHLRLRRAGAAINPLYSALKLRGSISHILARHVEGASHMAEGYTRARAGNIGVCIGTSGPAGTDMITGLYSAI